MLKRAGANLWFPLSTFFWFPKLARSVNLVQKKYACEIMAFFRWKAQYASSGCSTACNNQLSNGTKPCLISVAGPLVFLGVIMVELGICNGSK